jgi:hypothetical protein
MIKLKKKKYIERRDIMKKIFKTFAMNPRMLPDYIKIVNHKIDYLVIPTKDHGKVFFTHSLSSGEPDDKVLKIFASMVKTGKVNKLVVCYPDKLKKSAWSWVLKYHLFPKGVGPVKTHSNEDYDSLGLKVERKDGLLNVLLSAKHY